MSVIISSAEERTTSSQFSPGGLARATLLCLSASSRVECHHRTSCHAYRHREEESAPWTHEATPGPAGEPRTGAGHEGDYRLSL